jgi:hypothetical protein
MTENTQPVAVHVQGGMPENPETQQAIVAMAEAAAQQLAPQPEAPVAMPQPDARVMAQIEADTSDMFSTLGGFELAGRMAKALSQASMLPPHYHNNIGNCMVLLDVASRFKKMGVSPFTVAQQLVAVNGKFGWQGQFVIAIINRSGRFAGPLQFEKKRDDKGKLVSCMAWANDRDGNRVEGVPVTWEMAEGEGWVNKSGSKWKTMPEQMFLYRAAAFFGRIHCGDLLMGYMNADELEDIEARDLNQNSRTSAKADAINAQLKALPAGEKTA